jgi:hypothetical protein
MARGFTRCLIRTKTVHNLGDIKMNIDLHNVTEIRITKSKADKTARGTKYATRHLVITDKNGYEFELSLYGDSVKDLKILNVANKWDYK